MKTLVLAALALLLLYSQAVAWDFWNSKCLKINNTSTYMYLDWQTILAFSNGKEAYVTLDCEYVGKDGYRAVKKVREDSKIIFPKGSLCNDDSVIVDGITCNAIISKVRDEIKMERNKP